MKDRLAKVWKLTYDFDITDLNNDFFLVKFDLEANKVKVMETISWCKYGPYQIYFTNDKDRKNHGEDPLSRSKFSFLSWKYSHGNWYSN